MENMNKRLFFMAFFAFLLKTANANAVTFDVSKFTLEGNNPLSSKKTELYFDKYTNTSFDISKLQEVASGFEEVLSKEGFNFYQVVLPPQELDSGNIRFELRPINVNKVTISGNKHFSRDNILASLPSLKLGHSPNTKDISQDMILAQSNPAKKIKLSFEKGDDLKSINAKITVQDRKFDDYYLWLNNSGSELSTKTRFGFQANHRNILGKDHQLSLSFSVSPEDASKVSQYGVNYVIPVYKRKGLFSAFYSKSSADTGVFQEVFDISGAGEVLGLGYKHHLTKSTKYQGAINVRFIDKLLDSDIDFQGQNIGQDLRSRQVSLSYGGALKKGKLNWAFDIGGTANLSGGSFNDEASYAATRAGASASWDKINLSSQLSYKLNKSWNSRLAFFAQYTDEPLVSGEQFGLGGSLGAFGPRGFEEREVSLDRGYKASLEIVKTLPEYKLELGGFYDYGTGTRLNPQAEESNGESLSSVGIISRWSVGKGLRLDAQYGYILNGFAEGASGSKDGDSKLHFTVQYLPDWSLLK